MRKRRSRRLKPAPFLVLLMLGNVAAGLAYSRLTCLTKVRVEGVEPFDRPRIQGLVASLAGISCLQLNPRQVESDVLAIPEAADADFHCNIFGRGLLRIAYRKPVAKVEGAAKVLMDERGVLYSSRQSEPSLIELKLPPDAMNVSLTFQSGWPSGEIARLAEELPRTVVGEKAELELSPTGELCLNNINTGRVVFGSAAQLDEKLGRLKTLLSQNPRLLSSVVELNLTAPDHPSLVPLGKEQHR